MRRCHVLLFAFLGIVAFPVQALANAGTALMWAGMFHLAVGNAVIGVLEGLLIGRLFGVPKARAIGVMIAANYVSAWVGGLFLRGAIVAALPLDLNNGWSWFWVMVGVTFVLTLVLEFPFVAWAFRGARDWLKRSLKASLLVQGASYVLLFVWYWAASGTSLYTGTRVVAPRDLALPETVLVYFISSSDGHAYRRNLAGGDAEQVLELSSADENDRLFVRPSLVDSNRWDLVARLEVAGADEPRFVTVRTNLNVQAAPDSRSSQTDPPQYEGAWFTFGPVPRLGGATNSQWEFWAGFWPVEGLQGTHAVTGERFRISYETPFGAWTVRNAVQLEGDIVLFQLGHDQVCAFDPVKRHVSLLWHGRGPVPVVER
jgi:hypothetical protein